jgi:hypothetical protein
VPHESWRWWRQRQFPSSHHKSALNQARVPEGRFSRISSFADGYTALRHPANQDQLIGVHDVS